MLLYYLPMSIASILTVVILISSELINADIIVELGVSLIAAENRPERFIPICGIMAVRVLGSFYS